MKKIIASICTLIISLSVLLIGGACETTEQSNEGTTPPAVSSTATVEGLLLETDYVYVKEYESGRMVTTTLRFHEDGTFTTRSTDNNTQESKERRGWYLAGKQEFMWAEKGTSPMVIHKETCPIITTAMVDINTGKDEPIEVTYDYFVSDDNGKRLMYNYDRGMYGEISHGAVYNAAS